MSLNEILSGIAWGFVLLIIIGLVWLWNAFGNLMCGETLLEKIPSPDGSKVIYFFESGCGATSPNTYHYFLETKGRMDFQEMKDLKKRHEFFRRVRRGAYPVKWISNDEIELFYNSNTNRDSRVSKRKSKIQDVRINIIEKTDTSQSYNSTASPNQ